MRLIIFHYHLRPGGIRRIIELATPPLLRHFAGALNEVVLATGEAADRKWNEFFVQQVGSTPVRFATEPVFGYLAEQRGNLFAKRGVLPSDASRVARSAKQCGDHGSCSLGLRRGKSSRDHGRFPISYVGQTPIAPTWSEPDRRGKAVIGKTAAQPHC